MNSFKQLLKSKMICCGDPMIYHIRYDITEKMLRDIFKDEDMFENFIDCVVTDFMYKLGQCAALQHDLAISRGAVKRVHEILEMIERSDNNVCNQKNSQDV